MLFVRSTHNSVTLFWDKPKAANAMAQYDIYLNGEQVGTSDKTHFLLKRLSAKTEYIVSVRMGDAVIGTVTACTGTMKQRIDVTAPPYCAVGDGSTMNTGALQAAIDACGANQAVYLPAGTYLTGALRLHSHMELYLDSGAVLQGTAEISDYEPRILSRFEGTEMMCYSSVLNLGELNRNGGYACQNVVICGRGTIASGGRILAERIIADERERLKDYLTANADLVATCENDHTIPGRVRPRLVNMSNCQNIWISGITFKDGASWNVHMIYSDNIITDHCTFISDGVWNGDGWDPDSSTNCTLFASKFYTGDDAVAIKSGKNPEGNIVNKPCKNIRIFDCYSAFGHGICVGSEMSGGIENVQIWDCDLKNSFSGIEIKATKKRGGYVKNVWVRDCISPRVMIHSVNYNNDGIPAAHPPVFADFRFERLTLTGIALNEQNKQLAVHPIELSGFDVPEYELRDVLFSDIAITASAPQISMQYCKNVTLQRLSTLHSL